ncbi:HipA N-terminal domain-containing protein [Chitinophaga sp. MM2321]|uniref:HipA N-terminal domain-containing protein n=1 Tax=Chitinophaga sp. MM2321 TaxID=3137178 RepID=UPI0032D5972F
MQRAGKVFFKDIIAGIVWQDEDGYGFVYDEQYLQSANPIPVSFTLPLRSEAYRSNTMIPFFDGLIPEGWLLDIAVKNWKLNERDRMGLLLSACRDCIGAVSIQAIESNEIT